MKLRRRTVWRLLGAVLAGLVVAGLAAPFLNADRFGRRVRAGLEEALRRRVEIGRVRLDLFNGPGFSISDVVIYDDPQIGLEPLAYVTSLEARISLRSLWTGDLDFSSLRLVEPSVNLVKSAAGPWNFEALLSRTLGAVPQTDADFPAIHVRSGRVNFKFGDTKSIFYFTDADIDISPSERGRQWRLRFSGQPGRTDRPVRSFGRFSGSGWWRPRGDELDLTLELERSPLGEVIALVHGHDIGLHGHIATRVRLTGSSSNVAISGNAEVEEIHRWDLLPPRGGNWAFQYRGRLDLRAQRLELETASPHPVAVRFRAADYLSTPHWGAAVTLNRLPLDAFPEIARQLGQALPESLAVDGAATGVVGYSSPDRLQGSIVTENVSLKRPGSPPLRFPRAHIIVDGGRLRLAPATIEAGAGEKATVEGEYVWPMQELGVGISTTGMRIRRAPGISEVPLLQQCRGGSWAGEIRYHWSPQAAGRWTGHFEITDAEIDVLGMAAPLEIASAHAVLKDDGAVVDRLRARVAGISFEGRYRYQAKALRPHQFSFSAAEVDVVELERLFAPTLSRRPSLLTRALRLGRVPPPRWLSERRAEGVIRIGVLTIGEARLASQLRARLVWDGLAVELLELEAHSDEMVLTGRLSVELRQARPEYRLIARVRWPRWEADAVAQTAGLGAELLANLRAAGSFDGRDVTLAPDAVFDTVAGQFTFSMPRGVPRLQVTALRASAGPDLFTGEVRTLENGRLSVLFSSGERELNLTGTLLPFQLEPAP